MLRLVVCCRKLNNKPIFFEYIYAIVPRLVNNNLELTCKYDNKFVKSAPPTGFGKTTTWRCAAIAVTFNIIKSKFNDI